MNKHTETPTSLQEQIHSLEPFLKRLLEAQSQYTKIAVLDSHPLVKNFQQTLTGKYPFLKDLKPDYLLPVKAIVAIGQESIVFNAVNKPVDATTLYNLLKTLLDIEEFYEPIGGILGYHMTVLRLIAKGDFACRDKRYRYLKPKGLDIADDSSHVRKLIREGIENLVEMSEIYPVGGAGDRLNLKDEDSGEPLPAALLKFCGRSLLEGLIRDVQAREYLYFKLFHKQVTVPIAMMTSHEKNNHRHILSICSENHWFGKAKSSFHFFIQPLAPVITKEGNWSLSAPLTLTLKPGGHGVIWKVAINEGIFEQLKSINRHKAIIRQINNPVAGVDHALLVLAGKGIVEKKTFGFASCPRLLNTAEGMDVLLEKKTATGHDYAIANIEYTEFAKNGIEDVPCEEGSQFSAFPANTNILFIDLNAIEKATQQNPFPGMTINMKTKVPELSQNGEVQMIEGGRLETTMQNISDYLTDHFDHSIVDGEQDLLQTFITFNQRRKTISVTKKSYQNGSIVETPEGCFYDLMLNAYDLFTKFCKMSLPQLNNEQDYLENGPSFVIHFHPALGPLYSVIGQKIRKGKIAKNSELLLEIAEIDIENFDLDGSLLIHATNLLGHNDENGIIHYSQQVGKCTLVNVKVNNKGIDRSATKNYWKNGIAHHEQCRIILHGNAEFIAKDVVFAGELLIEVPDGHRMTAEMDRGELVLRKEKIKSPTWHWDYRFGSDDRILLSRKSCA